MTDPDQTADKTRAKAVKKKPAPKPHEAFVKTGRAQNNKGNKVQPAHQRTQRQKGR